MDEDTKLITKAVTACVLTLFLTIGGCTAYSNKRIADSSNPLATACAMGMSQDACVALGSR